MTNNQSEEIRKQIVLLQNTSFDFPEKKYNVCYDAMHRGHGRCVVLGINATYNNMCNSGFSSSYYTIDQNGNIYDQKFIQHPDDAEFLSYEKITIETFLEKIEHLPSNNMACIDSILSNLNELVKK